MTSPPKAGSSRKRPTLGDVAALAKVGEATVDRVLNERGRVRLETANAVLKAARRLGLRRVLPPSHHTGLRIEVLLNRRELPLIGRMAEAFERIGHGLDHSIILQRTVLADDKPANIAARLRATASNAVILYAPEDPLIVEALNAVTAAGVAVVTVISDLPSSARLAYAGIDHYMAGETAGFFLSQMVGRPGPMLVLCHTLSIQSHAERIRGLRTHLEREQQGVFIAEILEGQDTDALSERLLTEAVRRHPDAIGIYDAGAAHEAVRNVLRSIKRRPLPVFIGHELTANTRAMLQDRTMTLVIDQDPVRQAQNAIDILLQHYGYLDVDPIFADVKGVPFTLHGPFNAA
ncbi:MAG: LacI family DNA-binding transcriptional regulator [Candidatus Sulfotelmatobacter sp.]